MSEVIHTQKKNSKELEIRHFMYSVTQSANCGRVKICKDNTLKHHSQAHTYNSLPKIGTNCNTQLIKQ